MPHRRSARAALQVVLGLAAATFAGRPLAAQAYATTTGATTPGAAAAPAAALAPHADGALTGAPTGAAPDPRLSADDVVGIVLAALAQAGAPTGAATAVGATPSSDGDSRPIARVYAFASPSNRAAVGSVDRLDELVRDDAYRPLLGHRVVARGAVRVRGDRATQHVLVTTAQGERVAYTFTLARQSSGAYRGCWMTESVVRAAPSRIGAAQVA